MNIDKNSIIKIKQKIIYFDEISKNKKYIIKEIINNIFNEMEKENKKLEKMLNQLKIEVIKTKNKEELNKLMEEFIKMKDKDNYLKYKYEQMHNFITQNYKILNNE